MRSSLKNCGYDFPISRITINLAPADVKKEAPVYDLPMLISILTATRQLDFDLSKCAFAGELSLNGDVRPVNGILPMAIKAKEAGFENIFVPFDNAAEGSVVEGIRVFPLKNMAQLVSHLNGKTVLTPIKPSDFEKNDDNIPVPDFEMSVDSMRHAGHLK